MKSFEKIINKGCINISISRNIPDFSSKNNYQERVGIDVDLSIGLGNAIFGILKLKIVKF